MKRSGFKRISYEVALGKVKERQVRQRAKQERKTSPRRVLAQKTANKHKSEAAKAGARRSKQKKVESDKREARFKKQCRERDNYTCQWPECGYRNLYIPVHHINERSQRPDEKYNPENGTCLCWSHHNKMHHTAEGRAKGRVLGLLGGETYEKAMKEKDARNNSNQ